MKIPSDTNMEIYIFTPDPREEGKFNAFSVSQPIHHSTNLQLLLQLHFMEKILGSGTLTKKIFHQKVSAGYCSQQVSLFHIFKIMKYRYSKSFHSDLLRSATDCARV